MSLSKQSPISPDPAYDEYIISCPLFVPALCVFRPGAVRGACASSPEASGPCKAPPSPFQNVRELLASMQAPPLPLLLSPPPPSSACRLPAACQTFHQTHCLFCNGVLRRPSLDLSLCSCSPLIALPSTTDGGCDVIACERMPSSGTLDRDLFRHGLSWLVIATPAPRLVLSYHARLTITTTRNLCVLPLLLRVATCCCC